jgi:hypothetical protein
LLQAAKHSILNPNTHGCWILLSNLSYGRRLLLHGRAFIALLVAGFLSACGGSSMPGPAPTPTPPPTPSVLQAPTVINLYPDGSVSDGTRLFLFVTAVGSVALNAPLPLAFDTGSSGMTLFAPNAFPGMATACGVDVPTGCGFTFPAGQHSITFNNITVTDVQATRCYGGALGHAQTGNIGFASVTFGDAAGTLTTAIMPILFYYKVTANDPPQCDDAGAIQNPSPIQQGWFGVNTQADGVVVGGMLATSQSPLCTVGASSTCRVVSVFNYLQYANALDGGFFLTHQALQPCSINSGTCLPEPMLTIGLTSAQTAGLNSLPLACPITTLLVGFPSCNANIANSVISVSAADGSNPASYPNAATLFDSGTPNMILAPPAGVTLPTTVGTNVIEGNEQVLVTLPTGYEFSYLTTTTGTNETIANVTGIGTNIVGIDFFQNHDFYIDFTTGTEGWH